MNADAMRDSFDYGTYWWIIERLSRTNRPLRFADLASGFPTAPFFHSATRCRLLSCCGVGSGRSRSEARRAFHVFLITQWPLLQHAQSRTWDLRTSTAAMGHEVGLHYDVKFLEAFPRKNGAI